MEQQLLIQNINNTFAIALPSTISFETLQQQLALYINELIKNDFEKLVTLLYRIDVSEQKLKHFLIGNPSEDAGKIIADLIIERQLQKIKSRQETSRDNTISEEEKW